MNRIQEVILFDPLVSIGRWRVANGKPDSRVCDGRARIQANEVDFRPPFYEGALGSLSLNQKNRRYVFCSSGMANWWNMFSTSAVMAYGWRRNLWMTPRRALFRSGPWRRASLIHTPCVLAAESNTILALPFWLTENCGM